MKIFIKNCKDTINQANNAGKLTVRWWTTKASQPATVAWLKVYLQFLIKLFTNENLYQKLQGYH